MIMVLETLVHLDSNSIDSNRQNCYAAIADRQMMDLADILKACAWDSHRLIRVDDGSRLVQKVSVGRDWEIRAAVE